ncbi:cache domain-containing sensor histidine kinase [Paenibacillus piri]|uniref:Sensor histidine kinase n=1 Tax=Paenibacillus piri TaxID=2547395 RepID=A0A4V2ZS69_9BACL|nr:sensor histidine kinase [Paenibacillus piri]TDF91994.1 sensor histidine kinase [Paenibacillus piri]
MKIGQIRLKPLLFLLLILLCSFFLLSVSVLNYQIVSKIIARELGGAQLELLYNYQSRMMGLIENIESTALNISTHDKLRDALEKDYTNTYQYFTMRKDLEDWLNGIMFSNSKISSIYIYSDKFKPRPKVGNHLLPLDSIQWSSELSRLNSVNSIWIQSRPETGKNAQNPKRILTYVTQIYSLSGAPIGYVEVNLDAELLQNVIRSDTNQNLPNQAFLLLDTEGRLMSDLNPGQSAYKLNDAERTRIVDLSHQLDQGIYSITLDNKPSLYINYPNKYSNWGLIEITPFDSMFQILSEFRHYAILIGASGLIIIFLVASFLSGRLIAPIRDILAGFKSIEAEIYSSVLKQHVIFEFNQLHVSFGRMADRLKHNIDNLHKQHALIREAELRALQNQINPHFLYNTLDIINCMAAEKGITEISLVANRLANLFRIGLNKGNSFVTLREELEHCLAYVDIQQIRFPDKFSYTETVEDELKQCLVPKVILQPFIENAIKHGFTGLPARPDARIRIYTKRQGVSAYQIIVEDNGRGLPSSDETANPRPNPLSSGYGVKNVNERIRLYFGREFGIEMRSGPVRGTQVRITLPVIQANDERGTMYESIIS